MDRSPFHLSVLLMLLKTPDETSIPKPYTTRLWLTVNTMQRAALPVFVLWGCLCFMFDRACLSSSSCHFDSRPRLLSLTKPIKNIFVNWNKAEYFNTNTIFYLLLKYNKWNLNKKKYIYIYKTNMYNKITKKWNWKYKKLIKDYNNIQRLYTQN